MPGMWKRIEARRTATVSVFRHWAQVCVMATVALTLLIGAVLIPKFQEQRPPAPATSKLCQPSIPLTTFTCWQVDLGETVALTIALYVGLIFSSGVVLGVFGHSLYAVTACEGQPKAGRRSQKALDEMQTRMKLSDEQVAEDQFDLRRDARPNFTRCGSATPGDGRAQKARGTRSARYCRRSSGGI